jgi:transposase-like protein
MKKYSVEEKAKFIAEWEKSGKSRRAFSLERGLKEQTFGKWVREEPEEGLQFVEVGRRRKKSAEQVPAKAVSGPRLTAVHEMVVEKGDIKIRLPLGVSETGLARVIRALG